MMLLSLVRLRLAKRAIFAAMRAVTDDPEVRVVEEAARLRLFRYVLRPAIVRNWSSHRDAGTLTG